MIVWGITLLYSSDMTSQAFELYVAAVSLNLPTNQLHLGIFFHACFYASEWNKIFPLFEFEFYLDSVCMQGLLHEYQTIFDVLDSLSYIFKSSSLNDILSSCRLLTYLELFSVMCLIYYLGLGYLYMLFLTCVCWLQLPLQGCWCQSIIRVCSTSPAVEASKVKCHM